MPTVTVLAWCLIASTGRVSSSIAGGERGGEVLDDPTRRADRAVFDLVHVEREQCRSRSAAATRCAPRCRLRGRRRSCRRADRRGTWPRALDRGSEAHQQVVARRRVQGCARHDRRHRGPHLTQRMRRRVDGERGLVPEEVAGHGREHERRRRGGPRARRWSRARRRSGVRPRWRSRSARPGAPGRWRSPWPRRRRSSPAAPPRTRAPAARPRGRCASCPR